LEHFEKCQTFAGKGKLSYVDKISTVGELWDFFFFNVYDISHLLLKIHALSPLLSTVAWDTFMNILSLWLLTEISQWKH